MARPLRVQFENATYHVICRGIEKREIFRDDQDRERLLEALADVCRRLDWVVWAFCLMSNHYHLLLQTLRPTLSRGMRDFNGNYVQAFNRRHDRVGPLYQGRFTALFVDDLSYLHAVARYIVLNPVRAGVCRDAGDWRWSSYRWMASAEGAPAWLDVRRSLAVFDRDLAAARAAYVRFVRAGIGAPDPAVTPRDQLFVGTSGLAAAVAVHAASPVSTEVPTPQRRALVPMSRFDAEAGSRNEAIAAAHASGLYTLAEIGAHFGLHYASVSRIVMARRAMLRSKT